MTPALKRRKTDHVSDDDAFSDSFASFAEDESPLSRGGDTCSNSSTGHPEDQAGGLNDTADLHLKGESNDAEAVSSLGKPDEARSRTHEGRPLVAKGQARHPAKQRVSAAMLTGGNPKTSLVTLQVEELLSRSRPVRSSRAEAAEKALHDLKAVLDNLPSREPTNVVDAERELITKMRVAVPFPEPRPPKDAQYKLEFLKPATVNVVGSYASSLYLRHTKTLEIDMMVQMPDSLFQPKDYQDYRYWYRRAYYIACLAAGLREARILYHVQFASFRGNPLCPILIIKPIVSDDDSGHEWSINILPCISSQVFADDKLLPQKIALRNQKDTTTATSFYNSSIQAERQTVSYLKLVHSTGIACDGFKDACLLLRIWLRQRKIAGTLQQGGFGNFEMTALLAVLISSGTLSVRYSAYQLFKAVLQFIATKDTSKTPITIGELGTTSIIGSVSPVLFDAGRMHNLAYKMTPASYRSLRNEAQGTIRALSDNSSDHFLSVLGDEADREHLKCDLIFEIPKARLRSAIKDHQAQTTLTKLSDVLYQGLGDRINSLSVSSDPSNSWNIDSARPALDMKGTIIVAIRFDATKVSRQVDHGPSAEQKEAAAAFRKFWGDKAELRRFKDGSILESLVWSPSLTDQELVLEIVHYLLSHTYGEDASAALVVQGGDVSRLIKSPGLSAFQPFIEAYKTLEDDIRALDGLPLSIRQISATSEHARFASTLDITSPVDVVLQFESSTRWPDSLTAIQRTKTAFLLLISRLLTKSNPDVSCRVGLENNTSQVLNQAFLSITYPGPTIFHLRLHHDLELSFLQSQLKSPLLSPPRREATALALAHYKRTFLLSASHTTYMAKLATIHPPLSATIRLLKKWFASHHLTNHFPDPIMELLALRPFLEASQHGTPTSPKTGLLGALALISCWDWRTEPLLLAPSATKAAQNNNKNINNNSNKESWLSSAQTRFHAWRKLDPSLNRVALFLAYESDPDGTGWSDVMTGGGPGRLVAGRMTSLARAAAAELARRDMRPETLFRSGRGDFDFVIWLSEKAAGVGKAKRKREQGKKKKKEGFRNLEIGSEAQLQKDEEDADGVGHEIGGMFLDELRDVFNGAVVFFYGGYGSRSVCGLWNPVTERRGWKVGLGYSTVPVREGEGETAVVAEINKAGILGEIARLGGDLVAKIETVK